MALVIVAPLSGFRRSKRRPSGAAVRFETFATAALRKVERSKRLSITKAPLA